MVRKINNINRLILPKQHYSSIALSSVYLKTAHSHSIVNFRSRDVTYVTIVMNTFLGSVTRHPAGMHCPSWDDAFVSSFVL